MRIVRCVPVIGRTVRTKQLSSETLVVPALLVEVLHARDDVGERGEPLVELLVELVGRDGRASSGIGGELRVEVGAVRARLHRDLQWNVWRGEARRD